MPEALPLVGEAVGALLGGTVREQQAVRHVLAADRRQVLLPEDGPSNRAAPKPARSGPPRSGSRWGSNPWGSGRTGACNSASKVVRGPMPTTSSPIGKLRDRFPKESPPRRGYRRRAGTSSSVDLPMPHSRESAWPSSAVLIIVESPSGTLIRPDASKLATAALQRASSNGRPEPASEASACARREVDGGAVAGGLSDSGTALEPLGNPARFTRLTPPERGPLRVRYGDSVVPRFLHPEAVRRAWRGAVLRP